MSRREFITWLLGEAIKNVVLIIVFGWLYVVIHHPDTREFNDLLIGFAFGSVLGSGILLILRLAAKRRAA